MTRFKHWAVALAGGVSVLAMTGLAGAQTLEETLALAYNSNPTLQAERARLRATDEQRVQAGAARLPTVSASASIARQHVESESTFIIDGQRLSSNSESDATPKNYSVSAEQAIYQGGQISGAIDQATALVMAGRESLRQTEQTVLVDAVTAFMDVRRDARVVEIRRNNAEVLARHLQAARDRFEEIGRAHV